MAKAAANKKTAAKASSAKGGKMLVIVESPSKAKTIGKYLGSKYKVVASVGHVRDLPKSKLGIDIENDFEPQYISIRGKGDIIKALRKEAEKASRVYLATDPDREVGQQHQKGCTQNDAQIGSHAAQHHHGQQNGRFEKGEAGRIDERSLGREDDTRQSGPGRAQTEGHQLDGDPVDAHGLAGDLVLQLPDRKSVV